MNGGWIQFRLRPLAVVLLALLSWLAPSIEARPLSSDRTTVSGILTDRLSAKALRRWRSIERLILSEDKTGRPRYPTLRGLWKEVEASGHVIYIELPSPRFGLSSMAGNFSIEYLDPRGKKHIAVIQLYLSAIDQAYVGPDVARPEGFIPFDGLSRVERYAEVLGHELAHATYILGDLRRAQEVVETIEQTNELLLSRSSQRRHEWPDPELCQRLLRRDAVLEKLEASAEAFEKLVWQELSARKRERQ